MCMPRKFKLNPKSSYGAERGNGVASSCRAELNIHVIRLWRAVFLLKPDVWQEINRVDIVLASPVRPSDVSERAMSGHHIPHCCSGAAAAVDF